MKLPLLFSPVKTTNSSSLRVCVLLTRLVNKAEWWSLQSACSPLRFDFLDRRGGRTLVWRAGQSHGLCSSESYCPAGSQSDGHYFFSAMEVTSQYACRIAWLRFPWKIEGGPRKSDGFFRYFDVIPGSLRQPPASFVPAAQSRPHRWFGLYGR